MIPRVVQLVGLMPLVFQLVELTSRVIQLVGLIARAIQLVGLMSLVLQLVELASRVLRLVGLMSRVVDVTCEAVYSRATRMSLNVASWLCCCPQVPAGSEDAGSVLLSVMRVL